MKKIKAILFFFILLIFYNIYLLGKNYGPWEEIDNNINDFPYFFTSDENVIYVSTLSSSLLKSTDNGSTWDQINNNKLLNNVWRLQLNKGRLFIGSNGYGLSISDDSGKTLVYKDLIYYDNLHKSHSVSEIDYISINDNNVLVCSNTHVYFSKDNGNNWNLLSIYDSLTKDGSPVNEIYTPVISMVMQNNLLIIAEYNNRLWISTDSGIKWKFKKINIFQNCNENYKFIRDMFFLSDSLVAISDCGIFLTTDYGINWKELSNFPNIITRFCSNIIYSVHNININPQNIDSTLLYCSTNFGNSWHSITNVLLDSPELSGYYISKIFLNQDNLFIFLQTNFLGNWKLFRAKLKDCQIDFTDVKEEEIKNDETGIFPNPVSAFLILNNHAPNIELQKIEIFSVLGMKLIETEYKERIDVSDLAPGVYFLKIGEKVNKFVKI